MSRPKISCRLKADPVELRSGRLSRVKVGQDSSSGGCGDPSKLFCATGESVWLLEPGHEDERSANEHIFGEFEKPTFVNAMQKLMLQ